MEPEPLAAVVGAPPAVVPRVEPGVARELTPLALAIALTLGITLGIAVLAPASWRAAATLVGLYVATPVAKEAWIPLAHATWGFPLVAVTLLLFSVDAAFCLATLSFPVARLSRAWRPVARLRARVEASRFARRGLAVALFAALLVPIHSGGAILGTLAGRALGVPRVATALAVLAATAVRFAVVLLAVSGVLYLHPW